MFYKFFKQIVGRHIMQKGRKIFISNHEGHTIKKFENPSLG